jgi:hypothetical protein
MTERAVELEKGKLGRIAETGQLLQENWTG